MRQIINGAQSQFLYTWPKYPSSVRYHPSVKFKTPYTVRKFAQTDKASGRVAMYYDRRDMGVIEIGATDMETQTMFPSNRKIYIDYTPWYSKDVGKVQLLDLAFGYNYQRLYMLFKQKLKGRQVARLWLSMIDIGSVEGELIFSDPHGIPLSSLIANILEHNDVPAPMFRISGANYLAKHCWSGDILASDELNPFYNLTVVEDKIFVTVPILFEPMPQKWNVDYDDKWTVYDARFIYQTMFMFSESTWQLEGSGVLSILSAWNEAEPFPWPNIAPEMGMKVDMTAMDDCFVWALPPMTKFPLDWYIHARPTRAHAPFVLTFPNCWTQSKLPPRFWHPLTVETHPIKDVIAALSTDLAHPLKPVIINPGTTAYTQVPLVWDRTWQCSADWTGQGALMAVDHGLVGYDIRYHNFRRKYIRNITFNGGVPTYEVEDHEIGDFIYSGAGSCFAADGTEFYHIFGLENLSSYTYMVDVSLTAPAGSTLRFGRLTGAPTRPSMTTITWNEIAPHSEVLFTAYATGSANNHWTGTGFKYHLEMR